MVNIHKLKQSKKIMFNHLKNLYNKRDDLVRKLDRLNKFISSLEGNKKNCHVRIKELKTINQKLKEKRLK